MRKLNRPPAPDCLAKMDYRATKWKYFEQPCKEAVRDALRTMSAHPEGYLCNYCEGSLEGISNYYSIEHLYPRSRYKNKTFEWENLYLSCRNQAHCDQFKDDSKGQEYDPADLIRPDTEDPDKFFNFFTSGLVAPRKDLNAEDKRRACVTIEVLNLNADDLKTQRAQVGEMLNSITEMDMSGSDIDVLEAVIAAGPEELAQQPFGAVARQFFQNSRIEQTKPGENTNV